MPDSPLPPADRHPSSDDSFDDTRVDLVAQALTALERDGADGLDAFCRSHPAEEETIRRRLALLGEHGLGAEAKDDGRPGFDAAALGEELGDFRLLRPLGGGGMGVVWLAEQRSLGRRVAVKIVRPDQLLFSGARERFQREVESVARLQHPGIVPVFAVGEERGLPYFAMEHISGCSLGEVIGELQDRDPRTLTGADLATLLPDDGGEGASSALFDGSWTDVCTRIAREVAEALEHARRRGIAHRDVKPSNVMVTRGGRVLLVDFGLSWRTGDASLTRTGSAVGSLAYLPPEAIRQESVRDDPRQDVYSLGATLYELIALHPPFRAANQVALMHAIAEGGAPTLRNLHPDVSWELSTIVEVAMDRDPGRRYRHAGALARDLANALERRTIEARPPGLALRARRWVERHPARAVLLGALIVAPTGLFAREYQSRRVVEAKSLEVSAANDNLAEANVKLERANDDLADANAKLEEANQELAELLDETEAQRALAQESFGHALDAVDRMLLRVGEHRLAGEPRMEGIQRELVADALELYGWFLGRGEADAGLVREVARVALSAGGLHGRQGDLQAARDALEQAEGLLRDALDRDPDDASARLTLAATHSRRATVLRLASHADEARGSAEVAIDMIDELDRDEIELSAAQLRERARLASSAWSELGLIAEAQGHVDESLDALGRAVELLRELPLDGPDAGRLRYNLARNLDLRGRARALAATPIGALPDKTALRSAEEDHRESARILAELVAEAPGLPEARFRRARALTNLIYVLGNLGQGEDEIAIAEEALAEQEALVSDFPSVPVFSNDLGLSCINLSALHAQRGNLGRATEVLERGLGSLSLAAERTPHDATVRRSYGTALINLSGLRQMGGDLEGSLDALRLAKPELDAALDATPDDVRTRSTAWMVAYRLGTVLNMLARSSEAIEEAGGLLARGPGLSEIETYAVIAAEALDAAPPEERAALLDLAAAELARVQREGFLTQETLDTNPHFAALRAVEGFGAALDAAR
ncbi:MAG: protein kinase [Planctomycetota bacterium]